MSPLDIPKPSEIKEMRLRLGLTQAEVAEMAGVTQAYIAKVEMGDVDPRVSTLERVVRALERSSSKSQLLTAEKIMSSPIIHVKPTDTVERSIKIMEAKNISQLPVIDADVQVGSISEATLLHNVSSGKEITAMLKKAISEIMDDPFPVISKDEDVGALYPLLTRNPAVLVTGRGKIMGIITKADLFKLRGHVEQNLSPPRER